MSKRASDHIRSNVVGYIALIVAVMGVPMAWAVARNSIGSPQIKKNAVKNSDLADNSVGSPEVIDNSLTGGDVNEGTLGQVPSAASAASATTAGSAANADQLDGQDSSAFLGANATAADANLLDGLNSTAFLSSTATAGGDLSGSLSNLQLLNDSVGTNEVENNDLTGTDIDEATLAGVLRFGGTIPSGTTIRGLFACQEADLGNPSTCTDAVTFPLPAPVALTAANVNYAPGAVGEDDAACTGTASAPTAPAGKVCIYETTGLGTTASGAPGIFLTGGFQIAKSGTNNTLSEGSWAYTAP